MWMAQYVNLDGDEDTCKKRHTSHITMLDVPCT